MAVTTTSYRATPANRTAVIATLALGIPAAVLFAGSFALPAYGGVVQLIALLVLVAALFIAYKYIFSTYIYTIIDFGNDTPYLLVEQQQGKRSSLVFQAPLHAVVRVLLKGEPLPSGKVYMYTATLCGGSYHYVLCRIDGANLLLKIEANDTFYAALTEAAAEARLAYKEE